MYKHAMGAPHPRSDGPPFVVEVYQSNRGKVQRTSHGYPDKRTAERKFGKSKGSCVRLVKQSGEVLQHAGR